MVLDGVSATATGSDSGAEEVDSEAERAVTVGEDSDDEVRLSIATKPRRMLYNAIFCRILSAGLEMHRSPKKLARHQRPASKHRRLGPRSRSALEETRRRLFRKRYYFVQALL